MNLSEYLFIKAFSKKEYMDAFNKGKVHFNCVKYFWKKQNFFQQDDEGKVFEQAGRGYLIEGNDLMEKNIKGPASLDEIVRRTILSNSGKLICETSDFSVRIDGYICCFYLLPKMDVLFTNDSLSVKNIESRKSLAIFLEKFLEDSETNYFYVGIYDAKILCNLIMNAMENKGYKCKSGMVKYTDVDEASKISQFNNGDFRAIAFEKSTKYSYQKEYRIWIYKPNETAEGYIEESGIGIGSSLYGTFCYDYIMNPGTGSRVHQ